MQKNKNTVKAINRNVRSGARKINNLLHTGQANAKKLPIPPVVAIALHWFTLFFL